MQGMSIAIFPTHQSIHHCKKERRHGLRDHASAGSSQQGAFSAAYFDFNRFRDQFLTTRTGQGAFPTTLSATLPIKSLLSPLLPWAPMAINSTLSVLARLKLASEASPSLTMPSAFM